MDGTPSEIADQFARWIQRAFKVTYLYTALCLYVAALTAFLGWWARFRR